jgi:hypothetical protein
MMLQKGACVAILTVLAVVGATELQARDFLVDYLYRYNCADAQRILKHRNFSNIKVSACGGRYHNFSASWKGNSYKIRVSSATGDIVSMKRVK